jgi:hypothetical protein
MIRAWLVFATMLPGNASQTVTAIPFATFSYCERKMESTLHDLLRDAALPGASRRPVSIKPYCTSVAPAFWTAPRAGF